MNKPAIVLIHGFLSGKEYWDYQLNELSNEYDIYPISLKGFSGRAREIACDSIHDFSIDVIEQIKNLGLQQFHLLGHSMGGMIAQEIASLIPNKLQSLILYGTGPDGTLPGRFESLALSIQKSSVETYKSSINTAVKSWFIDELKSEDEIQKSLSLAKNVSLQSYINGLKAMYGWSGVDYLTQTKSSTLVIWGDSDKSYQWDKQPYVLWSKIKDSELSVVNGCAHNVHLEKPALFNRILSDFVTKTHFA